MTRVKQSNIKIGDKTLIELSYNGAIYHPITHVYRDILLKSRQSASRLIEDGYNIKQLEVDFGYGTGGLQKSQCISKESLMELLGKSNIGGFTVEQKEGMNLLLKYFGMDLINEKPRFVDNHNYESSNKYDEFVKDCIAETIKLNNGLKWQLCKECEKYFPLNTNFFVCNSRDKIFETTCKDCKNADKRHRIAHPDNYLNSIYNKFGANVYVLYKNNDVVSIYNHFITHELKTFPEAISNTDSHLILLKYLYGNGKINRDNLTRSYLRDELKLFRVFNFFNINEIHNLLFGNTPKDKPWEYPNYSLRNTTLNNAKAIVRNYLQHKQLDMKDVFSLNYAKILHETRLRMFESDLLGFVMELHDNKYPAYKFNIAAVNYWKDKDNRIRALKHLIEEDMKLELGKIPLYLTITSIKNIGTSTMYNVLKNYYNSLYDWVNEVYPNAFDPKDFDINYMRNEFDSQDEHIIHDILRESFDNVIYNPNQTEYTVKLIEKVPDWFVFTNDGCIIVEYFGLWNKERGMYNTRTRDYINRSKDKIEKYKTLRGYRFLYLYPEDMENNYEGVYEKIEKTKNNKELIRVG